MGAPNATATPAAADADRISRRLLSFLLNLRNRRQNMLPAEHARWTKGPSLPVVRPADVEKIWWSKQRKRLVKVKFLPACSVVSYHANTLDYKSLYAEKSFNDETSEDHLNFGDTGSRAVVSDLGLWFGQGAGVVVILAIRRVCRMFCSVGRRDGSADDDFFGRIFDHQRGNQWK